MKNLRVSDIQGPSHTSPYVGEYVENICGVVTVVMPDKGFFLQAVGEDADRNPHTSDAIDFYKSLENMLVTLESPMVTCSYKIARASISILSDKGQLSKDKLTRFGGIKLCDCSENPENMQVGDMLYPNGDHRIPITGDRYTG